MEKTVYVKIIRPYHDKKLNRDMPYGITMLINEQRAKELNNIKAIKIIKIVRRVH